MRIRLSIFRYILFAAALCFGASNVSALSQTPAPPPVVPAPGATAGGQAPGDGADMALPPLPPEIPAAQKLTLAQAIAYAQKHSPQLLAAGYGIAAARANYAGQRVPANPTIGFGGLNNTVAPTTFGDFKQLRGLSAD